MSLEYRLKNTHSSLDRALHAMQSFYVGTYTTGDDSVSQVTIIVRQTVKY